MSDPTGAGVFGSPRVPNEEWLAKAEPEAPLEPDLTIVDPHVHFWHHGGNRYFVEDFAKDVAASAHDIEATVFVECSTMYRASGPDHLKPVGETEFAVGQAAIAASGKYTQARCAAAIVGFADLTLGSLARETVDAHTEAANGRLRGIRQRAKWDPDPAVRGSFCADGPGLYLRPEFGGGIALLAARGLLFEASIFHPQIRDVTALARAHPDASIVVVHTGSPVGYSSYRGKEAEVHASWLADMKDLARCPNVSVKLGGLLMCLGNFDFTTAAQPPTSEELASLWRPYLEPCIELFGAGRCMVSSNFPVDKAGMTYGVLWNMFKRVTAECSADEKRLLFADTAKRLYRLEGDR